MKRGGGAVVTVARFERAMDEMREAFEAKGRSDAAAFRRCVEGLEAELSTVKARVAQLEAREGFSPGTDDRLKNRLPDRS